MELIDKTAAAILSDFVNPAVYLLSALAFVWFLYGVGKFLWARYKADESGVKKGKQHMLWGLIGLIIVFSASAIYEFITGFFN
ncbi:hypothetical protein SDC9_33255 [bioreactor metagenome]|uniref:Uncharacterized protein n=1 Tax=bioreactor metagenome TaxID=1076179 RepID=A0A644V894_9ZZZZ|nr:hypothetical protein [Candidatus Elulimicrobiales bacterium]